jgi:hypothetical protein
MRCRISHTTQFSSLSPRFGERGAGGEGFSRLRIHSWPNGVRASGKSTQPTRKGLLLTLLAGIIRRGIVLGT